MVPMKKSKTPMHARSGCVLSRVDSHSSRWFLSTAIVTALAFFSAPNRAQAEEQLPSESAPGGASDVSWLFVMTAKSGSFDGNTLTLNGVPPTLMFSDRPNRVWGHMDTPALVDAVSKGPNSFADNPPNAVLSTFGAKELPTTATVVLNMAKIEGESIRLQVDVLEGDVPVKFTGASLFIDHWRRHPPIGAFVVGAAVGSAVTHAATQPKTTTVVVAEPTHVVYASPDTYSTDPVKDLDNLSKMYNQGLISEAEYHQKKAEILNRM
jgi:hypothetical protein